MKHKYNRNYDYSETSANVRISMDAKFRLKAFSESLCDPDTGFVSMKDVVDRFLAGDEGLIENYLIWLEEHKHIQERKPDEWPLPTYTGKYEDLFNVH